MNNANSASILNSLVNTLKDGQEGFRLAAESVRDAGLKHTFHQYSLQRAKFMGELQMCVRDLGTEYEKDSSILGSMHRGWMNLRTALTDQDDQAILEECERGEDSAVGAYRDALLEDLPSNLRDVVVSQDTDIKAAHDKVKTLRDHRTPVAA